MAGENLLSRALFRGPARVSIASKSNQFAGRTTLTGGQTSVTVSTSAIKSDSLVLYGIETNTSAASGVAKPIITRSLSEGNYFAFARADNISSVADSIIMWQIVQTRD